MSKKVFQVSFKDNEKELKLYEAVVNSYNKSAFVKECIEFYLNNKGTSNNSDVDDPGVDDNSDKDINDVDWEF